MVFWIDSRRHKPQIMDLGNAIKAIRKEKKVSRKELAERSKLSITALYNIENNLSFPSKDTIDRLCASLGIPVSFLMFYLLILFVSFLRCKGTNFENILQISCGIQK